MRKRRGKGGGGKRQEKGEGQEGGEGERQSGRGCRKEEGEPQVVLKGLQSLPSTPDDIYCCLVQPFVIVHGTGVREEGVLDALSLRSDGFQQQSFRGVRPLPGAEDFLQP